MAFTGVVLAATPLALHAASTQPPTRPHERAAMSDTVKIEKGKGDHAQRFHGRRRLKPRATPNAGELDPRLLPDQPWETEFYVENDLSQASLREMARLATYRIRP